MRIDNNQKKGREIKWEDIYTRKEIYIINRYNEDINNKHYNVVFRRYIIISINLIRPR